MPDGGIHLHQGMLGHQEGLGQIAHGGTGGGGSHMEDHVVIHGQDHFPGGGVVFLLGDDHLFGLFHQDGGVADAMIAVSAHPVGEEPVQLAAQGVALGLLHGIKLTEGREGLMGQRLNL